ncbi:MAG: adhesin [Cyanobium sp. CZS 48M]|nr:adhesin [Cyanobium sp. CZS48M]
MLPHADHAIVDDAKVCDDLLSDTHPIGRFKARVFRSLGYTVESWIRLRDDLLHHGQTGTVQRIESSAYGMKVVISATLKGPNGASRPFRTIWLIPDHSNQPRLITAFPE